MFKNLFDHLVKEHDVILLEQEKQEIIHEMEQTPLYFIRVNRAKQKNQMCDYIQQEWSKHHKKVLTSDVDAFITAMKQVVVDANIKYPRCREEVAYSSNYDVRDTIYIGVCDSSERLLITLQKITGLI